MLPRARLMALMRKQLAAELPYEQGKERPHEPPSEWRLKLEQKMLAERTQRLPDAAALVGVIENK
jgi:hypothetical protein